MSNKRSYNRIDNLALKENYLLGLSFASTGNVFFRVESKEFISYIYDELGDVEADEWLDSTRLNNRAKDITNVLKINECNSIYQVFMGISPSALKCYTHYPVETIRGNLDEMTNYTKSDFGFVDGFESSFNDMSPKTEVWIPRDVKVGFAWHNPTDRTIRAMINLAIMRYTISVVRDPDLINRILTGRKECRIATIPISYNTRNIWDINPVKYGATLDEITTAVQMRTVG